MDGGWRGEDPDPSKLRLADEASRNEDDRPSCRWGYFRGFGARLFASLFANATRIDDVIGFRPGVAWQCPLRLQMVSMISILPGRENWTWSDHSTVHPLFCHSFLPWPSSFRAVFDERCTTVRLIRVPVPKNYSFWRAPINFLLTSARR
jgi:hypothetical protein